MRESRPTRSPATCANTVVRLVAVRRLGDEDGQGVAGDVAHHLPLPRRREIADWCSEAPTAATMSFAMAGE
jgi:hypothetical protein